MSSPMPTTIATPRNNRLKNRIICAIIALVFLVGSIMILSRGIYLKCTITESNDVFNCEQCGGLLTAITKNSTGCNLYFDVYCSGNKDGDIVVFVPSVNCTQYVIYQSYDLYKICDGSSNGYSLTQTTMTKMTPHQIEEIYNAFEVLTIGAIMTLASLIINLCTCIYFIDTS